MFALTYKFRSSKLNSHHHHYGQDNYFIASLHHHYNNLHSQLDILLKSKTHTNYVHIRNCGRKPNEQFPLTNNKSQRQRQSHCNRL